MAVNLEKYFYCIVYYFPVHIISKLNIIIVLLKKNSQLVPNICLNVVSPFSSTISASCFISAESFSWEDNCL